ncbi:phage tail protein [Sphingomonas psychrotolerans]|uniref:Uncharacterized protein n=1 Tax=Sphingomonas psychrotolerans TaxID=1327635 RepID=A0A2K8MHH3_9SPHN|nr:phage tail protein [Sphingomonas psychrotolerans]ATY33348.1 hypothetical protein CVN68_16400 [Sphingomonas psychrotolerans]
MATVILTVAGTLIGGPVGGAIGGMIGNALDRELLFKPKGREGPRLTELRVQTSSYGTQIPKLFGTMRVAGSVIWATDLVEHRSKQSGGKGRPSTTSFSYTASFAVALSARPIQGIGRIWADGKLLRGTAGDFKSRTGFRLHPGSEDQQPDPLIAAAEGIGLTPAHRGIAYAVFENLELADFGNRIPSLSFEVIADPGPLAAGAVVAELGEGAVAIPEDTVRLAGFAASGASVRAAVEVLAGATGGWFRAEAEALTLLSGPGAAVPLADRGAGEAHRSQRRRDIAAAETAPRTLTLAYYEPARDYQAGIQRAVRPGAGMREARMELAAAIDATGARSIAETALTRLDVERERRTLALPWDSLAIRPGERVTIAGARGIWRVDRWRLENMAVLLECVAVAPGTLAGEASGGRVLPAPDLAMGETVVHAFELPPLGPLATVPQLAVAAGGTGPGWRSAALLVSVDQGASWSPAGATPMPAVVGRVITPPGVAPAQLADRIHAIVVELASGAMLLHDANDAALAAGSNLAMVGDELLQFAHATPLGGRQWELHGLWRGRRGTEPAIGSQAPGDRFVLLEAEALATLDLPAQATGAIVQVLAQSVSDDEAAQAQAHVRGISLVPPAPAHPRERILADGATEISWVRRSRNGWDWIDGVDAPLGEESERYQLTLALAAGGTRTVETEAPRFVLNAEERLATAAATIRQIGAHGLSPPATLELPTGEG